MTADDSWPSRAITPSTMGQLAYLPPILPFEVARKRAQETWLRVLPEPVTGMIKVPKNVKWLRAFV